jgi:hypothetical protein
VQKSQLVDHAESVQEVRLASFFICPGHHGSACFLHQWKWRFTKTLFVGAYRDHQRGRKVNKDGRWPVKREFGLTLRLTRLLHPHVQDTSPTDASNPTSGDRPDRLVAERCSHSHGWVNLLSARFADIAFDQDRNENDFKFTVGNVRSPYNHIAAQFLSPRIARPFAAIVCCSIRLSDGFDFFESITSLCRVLCPLKNFAQNDSRNLTMSIVSIHVPDSGVNGTSEHHLAG